MHNAKANWDGTAATAANGHWEVDFASSPPKKRTAKLKIKKGDSAVDVAEKLSAAWNSVLANGAYPATPEGGTVMFGSTIPDNEIVGMRFVKGATMKRIPAACTEVEVVKGLFVYRSA